MRTLNIAILIRLHVMWDRDLAKGIAEYARTRPNWRLFLTAATASPDSRLPFRLPRGWPCDGAIAFSTVDPAFAAGVPLIHVGDYRGESDRVAVNPDNAAIGTLAAEHLHQTGFRRMTFFGSRAKPWSAGREDGFRCGVEAMGAHYLHCPLEHVYRIDADFSDIASRLGRWLHVVQPPLALMAANDQAARVASEACRLAGYRVPDQVAIIGVDNDLMLCELSGTPLSSIDPATERIGFTAAESLDQWMTTGRSAQGGPIHVAPLGVVRRRSTEVLAIDEDLSRALRFLQQHVCEPLTVREVAEAACLSRRTLERRFQRHVGHSVLRELNRLRVLQACERLRSSRDNLDQVARACGFPSLACFHRLFKREMGRTPADYRAWIRGGQ